MKTVLSILLSFWKSQARSRSPRLFEVYSQGNQATDFANLCAKWGSDKSGIAGFNALNLERKPHNYDQFYELVFEHRRSSISAVLEVGIGSKIPPSKVSWENKRKRVPV